MTDDRPHSRACGIRLHDHGSACHSNCPTCHGRPMTVDPTPPTDEETTQRPPRCPHDPPRVDQPTRTISFYDGADCSPFDLRDWVMICPPHTSPADADRMLEAALAAPPAASRTPQADAPDTAQLRRDAQWLREWALNKVNFTKAERIDDAADWIDAALASRTPEPDDDGLREAVEAIAHYCHAAAGADRAPADAVYDEIGHKLYAALAARSTALPTEQADGEG